MEKKELTQEIMHSFREVTWAFYHLIRKESVEQDTTIVQLLALRMLARKGPMGLGELAKALLLSNSTMSGVIDRLVAHGLVDRERAKDDRRTIVVRVTENGYEKQEKAFGEESTLNKKLAKMLEIPGEDLQHLLNTHKLILEKLDQHEGEKL